MLALLVNEWMIVVQIALVGVISYLFYRRRLRHSLRQSKEYTEQERQALIDAWHPEPLADENIDPNHYALNPKYVQG